MQYIIIYNTFKFTIWTSPITTITNNIQYRHLSCLVCYHTKQNSFPTDISVCNTVGYIVDA